ncbi:DUF6503 family protein [Marinoscillum sp.]|uniref:DUF6503 family protein n=1 Tax=Marinoscillum sp. TaxID=2024838 RepID=UPI003BA8D78C
MQKLLVVFISFSLVACKYSAEQAQKVVDQAVKAHGQYKLDQVKISFDFRDKSYSAWRSSDQYTYTRSYIDSLELIEDILINSSKFTRMINGDTINLPDSMVVKYSNSVNSVLYFVQLPYLLNDPAVIKSYEGTQTIENTIYDVIKVQFKSEDGGKDFEDEYRYWFNQRTHMMDYMAYNYLTDGGGVRFREAYNRSERMGMVFQDYINYEVPLGTPLGKIPTMFEQGKLRELSRIINENIKVTKR